MADTVSSESVAQDQIRAFVERIMRMREEAQAINADIREIYAEAKANGFDKTVLGKVVLYVEKRSTKAAELLEAEAVFDLYLAAFDGATGTRIATHTHEAESEAGRTRSESASEAASDNALQHSIGESREGVQSSASAEDQPAAPPSGEPAETAASILAESTAARKDVLSDQPESRAPGPNHLVPNDTHKAALDEAYLPAGTQALPVDTDPRYFIKALRPHCLNPNACGGQGRNHCFSCSVKINDDPVEAA